MSEKLDLEEFNRILMGAMKEESHLEFLKIELEAAMCLKVQEMENLVDALNSNTPYHDILKTINNIDSNCDYLAQKIDELSGSEESDKNGEPETYK